MRLVSNLGPTSFFSCWHSLSSLLAPRLCRVRRRRLLRVHLPDSKRRQLLLFVGL
ncbi:unnamed protein product [Ectocarpus sp. 6 AP-2014]